jgi:IclR family acetate operon transcriptional repressor
MKETQFTTTTGFDAVDRAVAILKALERSESPLTLSMIAKEVGLGQPTSSRYLASLVGHGYVEKLEGGRYVLGIGLYILGRKALHRRDVRVVARPQLELLHAQYNETVSLALWINGEVVVVDCIEATQVLKQGATVGGQNPWHASSLGKAILAWLTPSEVRKLLPEEILVRFTANTLPTPDDLLAELPVIRERGFAVDDEESTIGGRCIGAAVLDASGRPIGAISVSGPISRLTSERVPATGEIVSSAALAISQALGFHASDND